MKPLTDATLRIRDAIYAGLLIREGEVLTEAVARERANNLSLIVVETIREGLIAEMQRKAEEQPPPVRSRYGFSDPSPETMEEHAERILRRDNR